MSLASRFNYYRRILPAYFGSGTSQLSFWHETPEINPCAFANDEKTGIPSRRSLDDDSATGAGNRLGPYYMLFREKANYAGPFDAIGIPMLDYRGAIGRQYNPIAIAQWGLANANLFFSTGDDERRERALKTANWLASSLEQNAQGLWVWNHHFNWEYRDMLKAPWYSGLAQGQGISLLLRAYTITFDERYLAAAQRAFIPLTKSIAEGGVLFEGRDEGPASKNIAAESVPHRNLWLEEYIVDPPTHILNGFIWALWGVFDYWLARGDSMARQIFDRGVQSLIADLARYDTGFWSLYEQSGTRLKMLASPFYHRLHIVQLQVMAKLTNEEKFAEFAERWEGYENRRINRTRALVEKSAFKLLHY
jgi:heparosan-N-sulfate-glucuronate 5-epimerase